MGKDRESTQLVSVKRIEIEHDVTSRNVAIIKLSLAENTIGDRPADRVRDASHADAHAFILATLDLVVVVAAVADPIRGDGLNLRESVRGLGQDLSLVAVSIDVDRAQIDHGAKVVDLAAHIACGKPLLLQPPRCLYAPCFIRAEEDRIPSTADCVHSLLAESTLDDAVVGEEPARDAEDDAPVRHRHSLLDRLDTSPHGWSS